MIGQLKAIRYELSDMDASDKEEVHRVRDAVLDLLDDLITTEVEAEAEQITTLEPPATGAMAQHEIVERLADHLADEHGWTTCAEDREMATANAEEAIDFLIGDGVIYPEERWDEDCHACEQRIGDHLVDGRCPS